MPRRWMVLEHATAAAVRYLKWTCTNAENWTRVQDLSREDRVRRKSKAIFPSSVSAGWGDSEILRWKALRRDNTR